jgi:hypothetical protein
MCVYKAMLKIEEIGGQQLYRPTIMFTKSKVS